MSGAAEKGLRMTVRTVRVRTRRTFAIARGAADVFERVVLEVSAGGHSGLGEAAPTRYYGQDAPSVAAALREAEVPDPWDIEGALALNERLPPSGLSALDAALHDLAARRLGVPVYRLLGLGRPEPESAYTLPIADLETTVAEAERLRGFPVLKVKVGGPGDLETVRAVAGVSRAALWVDANEAFSPEEAPEAAAELRAMGVRMIEQPVPASAGPGALRRVKEAADPVPVIADESALTASDVPPLAGCVSGVNVKLAKCGGIRRALRMLHAARAHGMLAMLGCMVETSLGIAAAAHISGLFDLVDLDGAALLADDPFRGPRFDRGRIRLPEGPGLGVEGR
ncbi:Mandelate racemase/muconate lactonizing enzyme-like protein [Rubrobacter xylanophilus DSM 9941]|uniref:Dipeptide epimerase n=1 Tax=Rubrobacter xylanophilus (strain DSM 9941 / JCM 11954 / NBRC 16129 / PRD-1) TaxID=266117 RepID=Q1ASD4_RUBXD|nr:dipeptide epimerase [Rubrobacter xylanophilus]ABG05694.1 Mandelate racemase/muconate lactonizing enzyme-like protein [Rubrobacter xylanophilus DSM 9941]